MRGDPVAPSLDSSRQHDYHVAMPSALESLSRVPLFANLTARQMRKIAKTASEDSYPAGSTIVLEGGRTETLFVILEGTARIIRNGRTVAAERRRILR
jgi:signal-transduction protein with cAMP-binding, CBS, and nucleotidyltransferase domain